eukprot:jgi/Botrbrau1/21508/Bobra.174_2s0014.1
MLDGAASEGGSGYEENLQSTGLQQVAVNSYQHITGMENQIQQHHIAALAVGERLRGGVAAEERTPWGLLPPPQPCASSESAIRLITEAQRQKLTGRRVAIPLTTRQRHDAQAAAQCMYCKSKSHRSFFCSLRVYEQESLDPSGLRPLKRQMVSGKKSFSEESAWVEQLTAAQQASIVSLRNLGTAIIRKNDKPQLESCLSPAALMATQILVEEIWQAAAGISRTINTEAGAPGSSNLGAAEEDFRD